MYDLNTIKFRVNPRALTGALHVNNKGACDWLVTLLLLRTLYSFNS